MTNSNKMLLAALVAVLLLVAANIYQANRRNKSDVIVAQLAGKVNTALAKDSAVQALLSAELVGLAERRKAIDAAIQKQAYETYKTRKNNEALEKQVDSLNRRLGIRPDF